MRFRFTLTTLLNISLLMYPLTTYGKSPAKTKPGLVYVSSSNGSGLGFVIGKNRVLTGNHVVSGSNETDITIFFAPDFREAKCKVIASAAEQDLALIEVETNDIQPFPLATKIPLKTKVFWYNPLNKEGDLELKSGIVNGKNNDTVVAINWWQNYRIYDEDLPKGKDLVLQISGETVHSASGGPVLNLAGEIVGMISVLDRKLSSTEAISIDGIKKFLLNR